MPTRLPRLNVTISEEQHALLMRLGALQGRSAASYLRDLLDASTPFLAALMPTLEAAKAGELQLAEDQATALETMARALFQDADPDQLDLLEHIAGVMLAEVSPGGRGEADASESAQPQAASPLPGAPPSSNTGVRSSGPTRSKRVIKAVSAVRHG